MIIDMTKKEGINMSTEKINVAKIFGENVFNDTVMQERLPKKVYIKLKKTIEEGRELDLETADVIAHEMKEWAIEKGATHYTHWFLPLTGVTAEKHDSFISAPQPSGKVLMSFSGKELIKGEPDASRSEEHTSELQSRFDLVCRLLLEKKKERKVRGTTGARGDDATIRVAV